jgi:hypothetical protein
LPVPARERGPRLVVTLLVLLLVFVALSAGALWRLYPSR